MFDVFRSRDKAVRYMLGGVLGIVALSMVVTLIPGYGTPSKGSEMTVAEVNKEPITVREVQTTLQAALKNKKIPAEMIPHYVPQLIDQMIAERAVAYEAKRLGFQVSDEDVARAIRSMLEPIFQGGEIKKEIYAQFLAREGMTIPQFETNIAKNLLLLKLQSVALEGVIVTPAEIEKEYHRRKDKVKVDYLVFNSAKNKPDVKVTREEVLDYYTKNRATFMLPERRNFHVILADETRVAATLNVNDAELRALYDRSNDKFRTPERVKVRHILIKTLDKPKEELAKLEAKAGDLLKQIRSGADFGELAKKNSEDPGSAVKGGDLGWVTRGQMVKAFEESAFSLKPKEISNVVKTEYGFHIVQVTEKEQARVKPFEEVKGELAAESRKQIVYDKMQSSLEQARVALAKNPSQAEQIAQQFGLFHERVEHASANDAIPEIGSSAEMVNALAALKPGQVSPVIQVAPTKLAVLALIAVEPPKAAEFAEIQPQVEQMLTELKAQTLAKDKLREVTEKFRASNGDLKQLAQSMGLEVKTTAPFGHEEAAEGIGPAAYLAEAFEKPVGAKVGPVTIGDQVFLCRVADKMVADPKQLGEERASMLMAIKSRKAAERKDLFEAGLVAQLIKEGKIKRNEEAIKRLTTAFRG
ncbi:MAG TPA: peptidylprolyl isomerase [Bryobacteraceae bacterium]|nr:peptidylprolyl isomerase [Bryobacteraceae bacterium]